jgi:hypothetical protein
MNGTDELPGLLAEQTRYYRERAGEYEDWWYRRGRYDRGADVNARWFAEIAEVQDALERFQPAGRVLELACGMGLWTPSANRARGLCDRCRRLARGDRAGSRRCG